MTDYLKDFKKALAMWTRVNAIVRVILWSMWFLSFQAPTPSKSIMFVFTAIFTILIGCFEYLRLNE